MLALALALPGLASAGTGAMGALSTPALEPIAQTDRLIIKYKETASIRSAAISTAERMTGARFVGQQRGLQLKALRKTALGAQVIKLDRKLSNAEATELAAQIQAQDPTVEYAEPDRLMKPMATPNDPRYAEQWHYFETTAGLRLPQAWDQSTGSGVVVAVLDTGYRPHADLAANIVGGYDFISTAAIANDGNGRDSDARDTGDAIMAGECGNGEPAQDQSSSWHGTHVAGTIAAAANNNQGVAGVAYGAKVLPLRVLGKCGGYTSDIADAIIWASGGSISGLSANPYVAKVINMSLGGMGACDTTTQMAINSARSRGTVVVVAAGNENMNASNSSPANCSGVITVAATNRAGGRAYYSNYGSVVDVAAPGGETYGYASNGILSTLNTGTGAPGYDSYDFYQGTSMATPHVAGVVALMLSKNPKLTPDEVESKLKASTRAFAGSCSQCGTGLVDAAAAVAAAGGSVTPPPTPPPTGAVEVEYNNTMSRANTVSISGTQVEGNLSTRTDTDYFKVSLPPGKTLTSVLAPNSTSDYELYVYNSNGTLIGSSTKSTGQVETVSVTNTSAYTFARYIRVVYYSGGTGSTYGKYALKLSW